MNEEPRKRRREGCIKWDILFPDSHSPSMTLSWSLHEYYKWCSNTTTTSYIMLLFLTTTTTTIITSWDDDCVSYTLYKKKNEWTTHRKECFTKEREGEGDGLKEKRSHTWMRDGLWRGWSRKSIFSSSRANPYSTCLFLLSFTYL